MKLMACYSPFPHLQFQHLSQQHHRSFLPHKYPTSSSSSSSSTRLHQNQNQISLPTQYRLLRRPNFTLNALHSDPPHQVRTYTHSHSQSHN